jgi:DNA-directed RNA polymerase specialized sigma24 family protein
MLWRMRRDEALAELPITYREILTWLDEGRSHADIAALLGVDDEAVGPLVALAHAKLHRLLATPRLPRTAGVPPAARAPDQE